MTKHFSLRSLYAEGRANRLKEVALYPWRALMSIFRSSPGIQPRPAPIPQTQKRDGSDIERTGRWYFKRDILDRLDNYAGYAKRVRKISPDTYRQYQNLGAVIVCPNFKIGRVQDAMPDRTGFGAVAWLLPNEIKPDDEYLNMKFATFMALKKPPPNVERSRGKIYELIVFFHADEEYKRKKLDAGVKFYVSVYKGKVKLLKQLRTRKVNVPRAKKNGVRRRKFSSFGKHSGVICEDSTKIIEKYWGYDPYFFEHKDIYKDVHEHASSVFWLCYNAFHSASADVYVRVSKQRIRAMFCVDMLRLPYFFTDRDYEANEAGTRKRIFHIVRTHARQLASGQTKYVKSHFRGQRKFVWNGYNVTISVPGKHHIDLKDFDIPGLHEDDLPKDKGDWVGMDEVADGIAKSMEHDGKEYVPPRWWDNKGREPTTTAGGPGPTCPGSNARSAETHGLTTT